MKTSGRGYFGINLPWTGLIASKSDLDYQLNQAWIPKINPGTLNAYIEDFLALLQEGTIAENRSFISGFVKQLVVGDGVATLEYILPLASATLNLEQKDEVLSFE